MPSLFTITPAVSSIKLDSGKSETVTFAVTNSSGQAVSGRGRVIPLDELQRDWLAIAGEAERAFVVDGTEQYTVQLSLPPSTPAGKYSFRLDMVGVENPDEDYTQGPAVVVEVRGAAPPPDTRKGYVATVVAVLIGVLAGIATGFIVGAIIGALVAVIGGDLGAAIAGLLLLLLFSVPGPWIGAVVAVWLTLRGRNYAWARLTALVLAGVFPVWTICFIVLLRLLSDREVVSGLVAVLVFLLVGIPSSVAVPALLARGLVLWRKTGGI